MKLFSDGYVLPQGGGFTVVDENNRLRSRGKTERVITANETELRGVGEACRIAKEGDVISTDSQCIVAWVKNGDCRKRRADLQDVLDAVVDFVKMKKLKVIWEPRHRNLAGIANELERKRRNLALRREKRAAARSSALKTAPVSSVYPWSAPSPSCAVPAAYQRKKMSFVPVFSAPKVPKAEKTQSEYLKDALRKRKEGIPVLELSIPERVALEVHEY